MMGQQEISIFSRNHEELLEEAVSRNKSKPDEITTFYSNIRWQKAKDILDNNGKCIIYFSPIGRNEILYSANLVNIILDLSLKRKEVIKAIKKCPDGENEVIRYIKRNEVKIFYLINQCKRIDSIPMDGFRKLSNSKILSRNYKYAGPVYIKQDKKRLIRLNQKAKYDEQMQIREANLKEAKEGEIYRKEINFRKRNMSLILQKKNFSDYRCEHCNMKFDEVYGDIGREFIIAHHRRPIASKKEHSKITLDDISLVCANCHAMLHRKDPPLIKLNLKK